MQTFIVVGASVVAFCMAIGMIFVRMKAANSPTSVKRIILPPLFMSTGALMFIFPYFRIEWIQVIEALGIGMLFSVFLIMTSNFETKNGKVYLKPSKAFPIILVVLLLVRLGAKQILGQHIELGELAGMFYLLAFGMLVTWRLVMLFKFLRFQHQVITK